jgi:hypothetical protein
VVCLAARNSLVRSDDGGAESGERCSVQNSADLDGDKLAATNGLELDGAELLDLGLPRLGVLLEDGGAGGLVDDGAAAVGIGDVPGSVDVVVELGELLAALDEHGQDLADGVRRVGVGGEGGLGAEEVPQRDLGLLQGIEGREQLPEEEQTRGRARGDLLVGTLVDGDGGHCEITSNAKPMRIRMIVIIEVGSLFSSL